MPSIEERAERILEQARGLAGRVESGAEFSNAIFAPGIGLAAQAFPTLRERCEFTMTPQYAEIYRMLGELVRKFGMASGRPAQLSHEQGVTMRRQVAREDGQERAP